MGCRISRRGKVGICLYRRARVAGMMASALQLLLTASFVETLVYACAPRARPLFVLSLWGSDVFASSSERWSSCCFLRSAIDGWECNKREEK